MTFEMDQPAVQQHKRAGLKQRLEYTNEGLAFGLDMSSDHTKAVQEFVEMRCQQLAHVRYDYIDNRYI